MSDKATYTGEEWAILRDTPHAVGMAVAMAGSSGLFGTISEMFSAGRMIADAASGSDALIRSLIEREELRLSQDNLKAAAKGQDPGNLAEWIQTTALDHARQAVAILNSKGSPGEKEAYVRFLLDMAQNVANAAKEGSFLGFGGERVSAKEREILAGLRGALGEPAAAGTTA